MTILRLANDNHSWGEKIPSKKTTSLQVPQQTSCWICISHRQAWGGDRCVL